MSGVRAAPALLALAAAAGCGRGPTAPPPVAYDLAERALSADREGPWQLVLFGTPAALRYQGAALLPTTEGGSPHAWARLNAEIRLPDAAGARRALLEMEPYPGVQGQTVRVLLDEAPVAQMALREGRHRYLLDLPPAQADSRLRLVFQRALAGGDPARRRRAATLHSLVLGSAGDPALADAARPDVPPLLDVRDTGGRPAIVQAGPMTLRYVLAVPRRAQLRFTPGLGLPGRNARLRVTLDGREIWSGLSDGGSLREVALDLPDGAGAIATLGLHVEPAGDERPVWAAWTAPRILGDAAPPHPRPLPAGEDARLKADALRRALAGVNVVLVILDGAGARHFGCYGHSRRTTPEIDRIAAEGVVFDNAFTPAVSTLPAMTSVWTSLHPDEHQNLNLRRRHRLDPRLTLLPEVLSAQGIHASGFVANGVAGPAFGFDRGFAEFHEMYTSRLDAPRADTFRRVLHPWLRENRERRFFAYVHFREPHFPYDPPPPFDTMFGPDGPIPREMRSELELVLTLLRGERQAAPGEIDHLRRLYDGNLAFADHEVGLLRKVLEQEGLWDRTVLIVTADHGEALREHGHIGHEVLLYEEEVRIPLIVRFPPAAGLSARRLPGFVDLLDIAPTLAEIFDVRPPKGAFRGESLLPVVVGGPGKSAVHFRDIGETPWFGVREANVTCLYDSGRGVVELFDLATDPDQQRNLAPAEPLRAAACRQSLHAWILGRRPLAAVLETPDAEGLSPEQRENLRTLGYVN